MSDPRFEILVLRGFGISSQRLEGPHSMHVHAFLRLSETKTHRINIARKNVLA